jgi:archaellum component FlaC
MSENNHNSENRQGSDERTGRRTYLIENVHDLSLNCSRVNESFIDKISKFKISISNNFIKLNDEIFNIKSQDSELKECLNIALNQLRAKLEEVDKTFVDVANYINENVNKLVGDINTYIYEPLNQRVSSLENLVGEIKHMRNLNISRVEHQNDISMITHNNNLNNNVFNNQGAMG